MPIRHDETPQRASKRAETASSDHDVLVIGGGIHGTSIARALAESGRRVVLVERDAIASGATGRSTGVLNNGLVFLGNGGAALRRIVGAPRQLAGTLRAVRSYMQARTETVTRQRQRVIPFTALLPVFRRHGPARWQVGAALKLVSRFADPSVPLDAACLSGAALQSDPRLAMLADALDLLCVYSFTEYLYATAEDMAKHHAMAARRAGADIRTETAVAALRHEGGRWTAELRGQTAPENTKVRATILVNAAGASVDDVFALVPHPPPSLVEKRKGTHILVSVDAHWRGTGLYLTLPDGANRFLVPRGDLHVFGVTNTAFDGDPADARPADEEVAMLLDELTSVLPHVELRSAWSGVRPATRSALLRGGQPAHSGLPTIWSLADYGVPNAVAVTGASIGSQHAVARKVRAMVERMN